MFLTSPLIDQAITLTTSIAGDSPTGPKLTKSASKLLKPWKRQLVPKKQQKCYLIDSLSLASTSQTTVFHGFRQLIGIS